MICRTRVLDYQLVGKMKKVIEIKKNGKSFLVKKRIFYDKGIIYNFNDFKTVCEKFLFYFKLIGS